MADAADVILESTIGTTAPGRAGAHCTARSDGIPMG
jgi:hypothetical protein